MAPGTAAPEEASAPVRALRVAALVEPLSLLVLLVNLATVHADGVAALAGPTHGTAYLVGIVATLAGPSTARARVLAWVPAVGALLAARCAPPGPRGERADRTDASPPGGRSRQDGPS